MKGETRKFLDHVDRWVKSGTLKALMGVSGAGKTSLLDLLAGRVTMGVIIGQMLVHGLLRDSSFQRKTGYVAQQDLHLHTTTVRKQGKLSYVDEAIGLVGLEDCADAVIGSLGEGHNVELAARLKLLQFLNEPTSDLNSQTSWSICDLMQKLTNNGQAILCTIHQPSAALFQRFNRLLLLFRGDRTIYFGYISRNSRILVVYLVRHGAAIPKPDTNPAEYMLKVIGATPKSKSDIDWPSVWRESSEYKSVQEELARLSMSKENPQPSGDNDLSAFSEFAVSFPLLCKGATIKVCF
ncbi:Multidrug resistance protein [Fusarium torreyae]|uniref:Multidrug resistance protein n=1 Tax=Fusarium torreyae TaxID=1237075 RepID=A0A9W8RYR7_9HYPO|nr:Multidrug resistance protein [Fusarium torreyae]